MKAPTGGGPNASQFYVQSAAVLIALWPLAQRMWTQAPEA